MDRDFLIKLTNNLYRLTLLFPKKEPLRYKMREVADDILAEQSPLLALEYLGVLDSFFEVAKSQNWVAAQDVLNLQAEYSKLDGELRAQPSLFGINTLRPMPEPIVAEKPQMADSLQLLPERQEKILSFLKENGRAQVWQVKQILPEVTKRTLRRDFERLLDQGVVERMGEKNDTFYQLKISES